MLYLSVEEAQNQTGLRLVLTRGVPGPWSEAAKALFHLRKVKYVAVEQKGGQDNPELVAWTRHRNAPIALYNDEPPRVRWLELLDLAERLGSGASLIPKDRDLRLSMVGLINEIAGERGFGWKARLLMLHPGFVEQGHDVTAKNPMYAEYQYDAKVIDAARKDVEEFLGYLASLIKTQQKKDSRYLVGSELSAADVYWAYFSNMLQPLPPEQNPMPDFLYDMWGILAKSISGYDPLLIDQRDSTFQQHLPLPLEF